MYNVLHSNKNEGFKSVHNIYKTNYDAVCKELSQHNWSQILTSNFENDYNNFSSLLFNYDKAFSYDYTTQKEENHFYDHWSIPTEK